MPYRQIEEMGAAGLHPAAPKLKNILLGVGV